MEHKIGEIITLPHGRKAKVVEGSGCYECIFERNDGCVDDGCVIIAGACAYDDRTDHKNIIYKEIKGE